MRLYRYLSRSSKISGTQSRNCTVFLKSRQLCYVLDTTFMAPHEPFEPEDLLGSLFRGPPTSVTTELSPQAPAASGFFRLWPEIRNMVYRYALVRPKIFVSAVPVSFLEERGVRLGSHRSAIHTAWPFEQDIGDRVEEMVRYEKLTYTIPNRVCEDMVTAVLAHAGHQRLQLSYPDQRVQPDLPDVALLRVSKQIWREAAPVFYSQNCFSISPQCHLLTIPLVRFNCSELFSPFGFDPFDVALMVLGILFAHVFLRDRSPTVLRMIRHLELSADMLELNQRYSTHQYLGHEKWLGLMEFLRSKMDLKHLGLVAMGTDFTRWAGGCLLPAMRVHDAENKRNSTLLVEHQSRISNRISHLSSKLPLVPRLSLTLVWFPAEDCPRVRAGLEHDEECFSGPRQGQDCVIAIMTATSTFWVQMLRNALLGQNVTTINCSPALFAPRPASKLFTQDIRGRLFRSEDLSFRPQLTTVNATGRHFVNLVFETDDEAIYGKSKLQPVSDIVPREPYLGWKTLADQTVYWGDALPQIRTEDTTADAFEPIGGSENAAKHERMWDLITN